MRDPAAGGSADDAPSTDDALLEQHLAGDRDAFPTLVHRHRDRLWAVALRTLGNPDDAADALQDALVSAYRSAGSFRGDAKVTTWLHRIVVNACVDRMRRRAARPTVPLPADDASPTDPRDAISARELSLDVLAALRRLAPEQAAALVLVDIEGWPVDDAARILDVPVGTVKSRCARGRARLADSLAHLHPGVRQGEGNHAPVTRVLPAQQPTTGPGAAGEEVGTDVTP